MVGSTWLFACLAVINAYSVTSAVGQDAELTGNFLWDGTVSNQMDSTGSDSYRLCYKWNVQFLTSRDVLLTLRITTLAGNMSLQIIKYTGNTGGDLQGQTHGNMTGVSVKVAFANCTGVGVKVVANTFCSNGSHIKTAYVGFVTVSDPPKDVPCQSSPCRNKLSSLLLPETMGYRCYCKSWLEKKSCYPKCVLCPTTDFYGEVCNLKTVISTEKPTSAASTTKMLVFTTQTQSASTTVGTTNKSSASVGTTSESSAGGTSSIVGIVAGVGGGIAIMIVILVVVLAIVCRRLKQLEDNAISPSEAGAAGERVQPVIVQLQTNDSYGDVAPPPATVLQTSPSYGVATTTSTKSDGNGDYLSVFEAATH